MNNLYVTLNQVQTHLITWGDPFDCNGSDVIVCVTGNPGITDFYTEFAYFLYEKTKLPVCVIGHAGHEEVPDKRSNVLKGQEHLFNLQGQIQHKTELITEHIDKDSKIHLIGHSIGAWVLLEVLQKNKKMSERISSLNLLFPTIQKMAQTRSGWFLNNVMRRLHSLIMLLFTLAHFIPDTVKGRFLKYYLLFRSLPEYYEDRMLKFFNAYVGEKVLFLGYDEMDNVNALNLEIIDMVKEKTNVVYGPRDGWAPVSYMEDLKQFQPEIKLTLANIEHAFVLQKSEEVAEMVSEYIQTKMS